jgi:hypothetical protein
MYADLVAAVPGKLPCQVLLLVLVSMLPSLFPLTDFSVVFFIYFLAPRLSPLSPLMRDVPRVIPRHRGESLTPRRVNVLDSNIRIALAPHLWSSELLTPVTGAATPTTANRCLPLYCQCHLHPRSP